MKNLIIAYVTFITLMFLFTVKDLGTETGSRLESGLYRLAVIVFNPLFFLADHMLKLI